MQLPHFKYSPNVYQFDIFIKEKGTCSVCHEKRNLKYNCSFYCGDFPEYICPFCIANGKASEKYNGEFTPSSDIEEYTNISEKMLDEIAKKTPTYHSYQQQEWLSHCNEPCIFLGYGSSEILNPVLDEIKEDIERLDIPLEWITDGLTEDSGLGTYLFQCNCCGKHRLHSDFG